MGFNFLKLLQRWMKHDHGIPVIMLTARKGMKGMFEKNSQVRAFLTKPIRVKDVVTKIQGITGQAKPKTPKDKSK